MHPNELDSKRATLNGKVDIFSHFMLPLPIAEVTDLYLTPRRWHRQVLDGAVWNYSLLSKTLGEKSGESLQIPQFSKNRTRS